MKYILFLFGIFALLLAACTPAGTPAPLDDAPVATDVSTTSGEEQAQLSGPFTMTSPAFENEGQIPVQFGEVNFSQDVGGASFLCTNAAEAVNTSPALAWMNVPAGTVSLTLLVWDQMNYAYPDMPAEAVFAHWVIFNIPATATGLAEGLPANPSLADGSLQGMNNYPSPYDSGYGGPCPGPETHQYVFMLYALDTMLDLPAGTDLQTVQAAMEGHILAQARLTGYYTGE